MYSQFLRIWQEYILNEPCIVGKAKNALKAWEKIDKILEKYWLNFYKQKKEKRKWILFNAGFTYRLEMLTPRASKFRGPPPKVYNIFKSVIGLSQLCCHYVRYFLNNPSLIFLTQLHSILEYCRILNSPHHLRLIEID
jgi:hypothetical protein